MIDLRGCFPFSILATTMVLARDGGIINREPFIWVYEDQTITDWCLNYFYLIKKVNSLMAVLIRVSQDFSMM